MSSIIGRLISGGSPDDTFNEPVPDVGVEYMAHYIQQWHAIRAKNEKNAADALQAEEQVKALVKYYTVLHTTWVNFQTQMDALPQMMTNIDKVSQDIRSIHEKTLALEDVLDVLLVDNDQRIVREAEEHKEKEYQTLTKQYKAEYAEKSRSIDKEVAKRKQSFVKDRHRSITMEFEAALRNATTAPPTKASATFTPSSRSSASVPSVFAASASISTTTATPTQNGSGTATAATQLLDMLSGVSLSSMFGGEAPGSSTGGPTSPSVQPRVLVALPVAPSAEVSIASAAPAAASIAVTANAAANPVSSTDAAPGDEDESEDLP